MNKIVSYVDTECMICHKRLKMRQPANSTRKWLCVKCFEWREDHKAELASENGEPQA